MNFGQILNFMIYELKNNEMINSMSEKFLYYHNTWKNNRQRFLKMNYQNLTKYMEIKFLNKMIIMKNKFAERV